MKKIIVGCGIYDCNWNMGSQFRRQGNCAHKQITISLDDSQCSQYIERSKFQAKITAKMALLKRGLTDE